MTHGRAVRGTGNNAHCSSSPKTIKVPLPLHPSSALKPDPKANPKPDLFDVLLSLQVLKPSLTRALYAQADPHVNP